MNEEDSEREGGGFIDKQRMEEQKERESERARERTGVSLLKERSTAECVRESFTRKVTPKLA